MKKKLFVVYFTLVLALVSSCASLSLRGGHRAPLSCAIAAFAAEALPTVNTDHFTACVLDRQALRVNLKRRRSARAEGELCLTNTHAPGSQARRPYER